MIHTEMGGGGGTISLNGTHISRDMGPGGGPYISNDMGLPGPMSLGKWGRGGGTISLNMGPISLGIWGHHIVSLVVG